MKIVFGFLGLILIGINATLAADIEVSAKVRQGYCSNYFGLLNFEIENNTDKWVEIRGVEISFGNPKIDDEIGIPVGAKLIAWHDAMTYRIQKNRQLVGLIFSGLAIANANRSNDSNTAKSMVNLGLTGLSILAATKNPSLNDMVPDSHLLSLPIHIPPGLSVNKWIVFQTTDDADIPYLDELDISLQTVDNGSVDQNIFFRGSSNSCSWQKKKKPSDY